MDNLRQQFNPEGSLLRLHQLRMLEMLLYVNNLCTKHGIRYWLSSGTLLGAARHKGFIPWDDDVDIEMLRGDYKKLLAILATEPSEHYILQTHQTDKNYFFPFAKLRDKRSVLCENNNVDCNFVYRGIYIDIFPLEVNKYPLSKVFGKIQLYIQHTTAHKKGCAGWRKYHANLLFTFMHSLTAPLLRKCYKIGSQNEVNHTFGVCFYKKRNLDEIFPLTLLPFEGHLLPVPGDYDGYLKRIYGDYMSLPPLDQIVPHTTRVRFLD